MSLPIAGSEILIECLKSTEPDIFIPGNIYGGITRGDSGIHLIGQDNREWYILYPKCAIGEWRLINQPKELKIADKTKIWEAIIQASNR